MQYLSQKILDDVFGKKMGSVMVEGIIDANDEDDFHAKLVSLMHTVLIGMITIAPALQTLIDLLTTL